jgi:TPR repeat protein
MMTLLGQHGERQDFGRGVQLIRLSAHTADENAPQGAYVSLSQISDAQIQATDSEKVFGMLQARELPNISIPEIYLPLDLNGARVNLEKAAYLGFAKAQVKMGQAYELCQLGCDFNPALSLHYNALASRQGEAEADMAISKWFLCGYEGIFEKNEELAYTYAQRAAHDKLATAEFAMGYFNEIGMFVAVNLIEARAWYEKAAEHGNKDAFGRIEGITKDKTLSKKDHEDVAIARIKSQYGSMRGKRPDRLKKEPVPPMPSISDTPEPPSQPIRARTTPSPAVPILSEDTVTMPDPSTIPRPNSSLNPYGNIQIPARPSSAAPYPLEDVPPGQGGPRPGSAIGHNNPQLALPNPAVRPSSAFGINPHLMQEPIQAPYPNESPMGLPYSGADYRGPGGPGRPTSAMDYRRGGRGDDYPGPGRGRGRIQSGGYGPQDYRASGGLDIDNTGRGRGRGDKPRPEPEQPQGPKLDIGFSAPLDAPSGRNKLSKPTANPNKPPGPPNDHLRPDRSATTPQPLKNDRRHDDRAQSTRPSSPPTSRPPRHETAGTLGAVNKPLPPRSTQSSPQIPQQHHPATAGAPPAPKPPASPRPPGKGPKTFDEMGVPNATKDNDCVSLTRKSSLILTDLIYIGGYVITTFFWSFEEAFLRGNIIGVTCCHDSKASELDSIERMSRLLRMCITQPVDARFSIMIRILDFLKGSHTLRSLSRGCSR